MIRKCLFSAVIFLALLILHASLNAEKTDRLLVRITAAPEKMMTLSRKQLDFASMAQKTPRDVIVTEKELASLLAEGYQAEILQRESGLAGQALDPFYQTLEETLDARD